MSKSRFLLLAGLAGVILFVMMFAGYHVAQKAVLFYKFYTVGRYQTHPELEPILADLQYGLSANRHLHNGQVNLEDIKEGQILYTVHKDGSENKILITRAPYQYHGDCRFDFVWWYPEMADSEFIWQAFCSDFGLVEYNGPLYGWNPTNYLKFSDAESLSYIELQLALDGKRLAP